jgi:hypothetical protein
MLDRGSARYPLASGMQSDPRFLLRLLCVSFEMKLIM